MRAERFELGVSAAAPGEAGRAAAEAIPAGGVLYYALGGGLGHVTRGLALSRAWSALRSEPFTILRNAGPPLPEPGVTLQLTDREPEPQALAGLVQELLGALEARLLVVDAFPAGILGELSAILEGLPCRKAAVLRWLRPEWVERWDLRRVLGRYSGVALVEPGAALDLFPEHANVLVTAPVLIRTRAEVLDCEAARAALGHRDERPLLLVSVTGMSRADQGLLNLCAKIGERLGAAVRFATPYPGAVPAGEYVRHYPLVEWLLGADVVVGPSGYNLFYEAALVGAKAVWVPQPRVYDDQLARAAGQPIARSPEELERQTEAALMGKVEASPRIRDDGAQRVAQWLGELAG